MCLLAVQYKSVPEAPILVAANREEAFDRPSLVPSIQPGKPRVLSGIDARAGGTWLGVNQNGLFVGAANRPKLFQPQTPRSRGLLCRDLLRANSARHAVDIAMEELTANKYDGINFIIADYESGWAVHGGDDANVSELIEGLNIVSAYDLNDLRDERQKLARRLLTLQTLDSAVKFLAVASKAFARPPAAPDRPGMVVRGKERGTVSSTLIALGKKPRDAIFQYANGAPDLARYEDYSPLLRDILSRGLRESRTKQKA
ncbi:MAG: NRDE family protein [Planctomycetaceae bacterium]|nr:NRDE family protein [Planctomycetaceae bacterium]